MKKILVILAVILSTVEMFRTGNMTALFLSLVIVQLIYGKAIYKAWYKAISR